MRNRHLAALMLSVLLLGGYAGFGQRDPLQVDDAGGLSIPAPMETP